MTRKLLFIESPDQISGDFFLKLVDLDARDFPNPWTSDGFKEFLSAHQFLIVALISDEKLLGFALFELQIVDSFSHLLKIVVNSDERGLGLGKELLKESLNWLGKKNIKKKFLEVESTNIAAIKLYEAFGLKKIHVAKDFYGNGRHADIMTLENES